MRRPSSIRLRMAALLVALIVHGAVDHAEALVWLSAVVSVTAPGDLVQPAGARSARKR